MQLDIINFDGKKVGSVELDNGIFGLEPRADILHRVVTWQRAKQRAGTHAVKSVSDVAGSGKNCCVAVLRFRQGRLMDKKEHVFFGEENMDDVGERGDNEQPQETVEQQPVEQEQI